MANLLMIFSVCFAMGIIVTPQAEGARAFFVFGDSLVDYGNNNYLNSLARADHPPYGIDSPTHRPSGRFSNGLTIADLISEKIGSESTLPYLSPELKGKRLLTGANFASAGAGILNDTGTQFVDIIKMPSQLENFREYQQRLSALVGKEKANRLVNKALVLVTVGGNDFINNYFFTTDSARSRQLAIPDYIRLLISEYRKLLLRLFQLGARRVIVTGTGLMGCAPAELALHSMTGGCVDDLQGAGNLYNQQLLDMTQELNARLRRDVFIFSDIGRYLSILDDFPLLHGFVTSKVACCGQGPYNGLGACTSSSFLCPNRDLYVFWDGFHPTERANRMIVEQIMSGSLHYMTPMNLSTIIALDSQL